MTPSRVARRAFTVLLLLGLTAGLVAQQTDSANPRLYGYNAAFTQIRSVARPGDVILYAPQYLNVDVAYFAPGMRAEPATARAPALSSTQQIFVVGSFNFTGTDQADATTQTLLRTLGRSRHLNAVLRAPNVTVWEFA